MHASTRVAALLGCALIATAACGSSAPAAAPGGTAVEAQGFAFKPATLDVTKGATVTWTNRDSARHIVASGKPGTKDGKFEGPIDANATFSFTFSEVGTFAYFCSIHTSMTGTVTVK